MKRACLGELEEVVLLTVAVLQESAYCASITQTIDQQMARSISFPTVHTTLQQLQKSGLLFSPMSGATAQQGGRQKRLFTLTTAAQRFLIEYRRADVRQIRAHLWDGPAIRQISTQVLLLWEA
ncbi:PadR family transcriptional regulator [Spirosoma aureum]|uniref:PadR family transcriptional regulator n=1 Tax=Spirosoma aureum TaxID=2692134 RepID=A0A6G9ARY2_9BACT|nr:PadR family transcriptional regulator [Spirosoma aureum]QIP15045.1 PadR family transcriptional regulator [Spirosoma aureum]